MGIAFTAPSNSYIYSYRNSRRLNDLVEIRPSISAKSFPAYINPKINVTKIFNLGIENAKGYHLEIRSSNTRNSSVIIPENTPVKTNKGYVLVQSITFGTPVEHITFNRNQRPEYGLVYKIEPLTNKIQSIKFISPIFHYLPVCSYLIGDYSIEEPLVKEYKKLQEQKELDKKVERIVDKKSKPTLSEEDMYDFYKRFIESKESSSYYKYIADDKYGYYSYDAK